MKPLGRKQSIKNSDWIEAAACIEEAVSRPEMDELSARTVDAIRAAVDGKKAAY